MNPKLLQLSVAKVDEALYTGGVQSVTVPAVDGELTLMADHEPLITPLQSGTITVLTENGDTQTFLIDEGTLEVSNNTATILV